SADRPFRPAHSHQHRARRGHEFCRRLYQLFPRWRDRRGHCLVADRTVSDGVLFGAKARRSRRATPTSGGDGGERMMTVFEWVAGPMSYPFMQRALVVSVIVAAVCAVLSCYLVLKGWSLMGDAISHAVLPGIVIAYVLNLPLA